MQSERIRLVDEDMVKKWFQPRSPVLLGLYEARRHAIRVVEARLIVIMLAGFYASVLILDSLFIPDVLIGGIVVRLVIGPMLAIFGIWAMARSTEAITIDRISNGLIVTGALLWLVLLCLSNNHEGIRNYFPLAPTFFLCINILNGGNFQTAFISSLVIFFFLCMTAIGLKIGDFQFMTANASLNLWTCILTLMTNWRSNGQKYAVFLQTLKSELQQEMIKERNAELFRLSTTDALTGIANRRAIDESLDSAWRDWTGDRKQFAFILVDIDFFKQFNDTYGHQMGDQCLQRVAAAMLRVTSRHVGVIGRFGGEEFVALVYVESIAAAIVIAEELRQDVHDMALPHDSRSDGWSVVTVSVGVAFTDRADDEKPVKLVSRADDALYHAKASGRNCVCSHDPSVPITRVRSPAHDRRGVRR